MISTEYVVMFHQFLPFSLAEMARETHGRACVAGETYCLTREIMWVADSTEDRELHAETASHLSSHSLTNGIGFKEKNAVAILV